MPQAGSWQELRLQRSMPGPLEAVRPARRQEPAEAQTELREALRHRC